MSAAHLDIKDCARFVAYANSKVCRLGWMEILRNYSSPASDPAELAVGSWFRQMSRGASFEDSLTAMGPRLPLCLERLLLLGYKNSIMDRVLGDIDGILTKKLGARAEYQALSLLVDKYSTAPQSDFICSGCLEKELDTILRRAVMEKASEVILEQDGERFFIQHYLGPKAVTYSEPCHSKVYKTIKKYLEEQTEGQKTVELPKGKFKIDKRPDNRYELAGETLSLLVYFD